MSAESDSERGEDVLELKDDTEFAKTLLKDMDEKIGECKKDSKQQIKDLYSQIVRQNKDFDTTTRKLDDKVTKWEKSLDTKIQALDEKVNELTTKLGHLDGHVEDKLNECNGQIEDLTNRVGGIRIWVDRLDFALSENANRLRQLLADPKSVLHKVDKHSAVEASSSVETTDLSERLHSPKIYTKKTSSKTPSSEASSSVETTGVSEREHSSKSYTTKETSSKTPSSEVFKIAVVRHTSAKSVYSTFAKDLAKILNARSRRKKVVVDEKKLDDDHTDADLVIVLAYSSTVRLEMQGVYALTQELRGDDNNRLVMIVGLRFGQNALPLTSDKEPENPYGHIFNIVFTEKKGIVEDANMTMQTLVSIAHVIG